MREAPITIDSDSEGEVTFGSYNQQPVQQPVTVEGSPLKVLKGKNFRLVVPVCLHVCIGDHAFTYIGVCIISVNVIYCYCIM